MSTSTVGGGPSHSPHPLFQTSFGWGAWEGGEATRNVHGDLEPGDMSGGGGEQSPPLHRTYEGLPSGEGKGRLEACRTGTRTVWQKGPCGSRGEQSRKWYVSQGSK